jgi:hypothetical protein
MGLYIDAHAMAHRSLQSRRKLYVRRSANLSMTTIYRDRHQDIWSLAATVIGVYRARVSWNPGIAPCEAYIYIRLTSAKATAPVPSTQTPAETPNSSGEPYCGIFSYSLVCTLGTRCQWYLPVRLSRFSYFTKISSDFLRSYFIHCLLLVRTSRFFVIYLSYREPAVVSYR